MRINDLVFLKRFNDEKVVSNTVKLVINYGLASGHAFKGGEDKMAYGAAGEVSLYGRPEAISTRSVANDVGEGEKLGDAVDTDF